MSRRNRRRDQGMRLVLLSLAALVPSASPAQSAPEIRPIATVGDAAGDVKIGESFEVGALNNAGQVAFVSGGILFQTNDGKIKPVQVPGQEYRLGKWPTSLGFFSPVSMNQSGNIVFNPGTSQTMSLGIFIWDFLGQRIIPVTLPGLALGVNLIVAEGGGSVPVINQRNEIAFVAPVEGTPEQTGEGIFLLGRGGGLIPIALPGQSLPGGLQLRRARLPSINDSGAVAFLAAGPEGEFGAYLYDKGTITALAAVGSAAPGGGTIAAVAGVRLNSANRTALIVARVDDRSNPDGIYLFSDGTLAQVALPGQGIPGGATLKGVLTNSESAQGPTVSAANASGEYAFVARLAEGIDALYLISATGKLSPILKEGVITSAGQVTSVGGSASFGVGLNDRGQIALPVRINNGADTIVVLTPNP